MKKCIFFMMGMALFLCGSIIGGSAGRSRNTLRVLTAAADSEDVRSTPEVYTGTVVAIGRGAGLGSASFTLRITGHTSDEDSQRHLTILAEQGQASLLKAIETQDLGSFAIGGRVGRRINVVRESEIDGKRRIRVVFERWLRMAEVRGGYRSVDYPFGYIELFIDKNGKGQGTYIGAAKIKWERDDRTRQHQVEIENFATYPDKLMGVMLRK